MKRNAQIQLGESIFVVIIIILLIVFGLVFYSQAQKQSIGDDDDAFTELETITLAQYSTTLTELVCSLQEVQYANCYDKTKLDAFTELVAETSDETSREFYFSQLGNARLEILQIFPFLEDEDGNPAQPYWLLYDNEPQQISNSRKITLPVNIYDPVKNTRAFATLEITQYI